MNIFLIGILNGKLVLAMHSRRFKSDFDRSKSDLKRRLCIARAKFPFKMPIKKLFQVSDGIELDYIKDLDNIIPDLYGESIDKLKSIKLYSSHNVSCLVKKTDEDEDATQTFVSSNDLMLVEQIRLYYLKNLKLLFDCSFQYISLRNLQDIEISYCGSLLTVFPLTVAQGLSNLRRIKILSCDSLMVVISAGDEQTTIMKNCSSMKSRWGHGVDEMPNVDVMPNHNFTREEALNL
uniref:Disease resistance protein At4g27190-like leucine-rich repeats domain-containing protein n=1 Tax=Lactuca sativa TaxID=4236 RepID=A0A9R1UM56_LACSA|nr:hypothetical protein LSAT_V11C800437830 [Lactuca sativa]